MKKFLTVLLIATFLMFNFGTIAFASPVFDRDDRVSKSEVSTEMLGDEHVNGNYDMTYYSDIPGILEELEKSDRVRVQVIGQSAGGRDLYCVVVTEPSAHGKYGKYQMLNNLSMKDPEKALAMIEKDPDYKVPIFINNSIHGGETCGVDAGLRILEELAFGESEEIDKILKNTIVVMNVVANPDGRVNGWRQNDNGFDVNRDMATLSQPEAQAILKIVTEWKPMITLDNHGFVRPILIDACSMPHNPNMEEDIYLDWELKVAEAMEGLLVEKEGQDFEFAEIPLRDYEKEGGWDDYTPIFIPSVAGYYGLTNHTIETGPRDERGVLGHYWTNWAALLYASDNREAMFRDKIEIFSRGVNFGGPNGNEFPFAHIIPMDEKQRNPVEAAKTMEHLKKYDIDVKVAASDFTYDGKVYSKGTYVVPLNQPLAGLANSLLSEGQDLTDDPGLPMYDIASVDLPELWGFTRVTAEEPFDAKLRNVSNVEFPKGAVVNSKEPYFILKDDTNNAIVAVNKLLSKDYNVMQLTADFDGLDAGTFMIEAKGTQLQSLAKNYSLTFIGTGSVPADVKELKKVKIAAFTAESDSRALPADPDTPNTAKKTPGYDYGTSGSSGKCYVGATVFVLEQLGFDVDIVRDADIAEGLDDYDVLISSEDPVSSGYSELSKEAKDEVADFMENGGAYIGFNIGGAELAKSLSLVDTDSDASLFWSYYNGVMKINYDQDNAITGSYPENDFVFGFEPTYFYNYGEDVEVLGSYDDDALFTGYMPSNEAFNGEAAIVKQDKAILFGNDLIFRAHIKTSFRLLANSIYQLSE